MEQLAQKVEGMSLEAIADAYPNCHPELNPFDFYRAHIASILSGISGVEPKIIFSALSWTTSLDKGDLILAAPALRVKGQKPDELAKQWSEKVGGRARIACALFATLHETDRAACSSPTMTPSSRSRPWSTTSWPSSSSPPRSSRPLFP